MTLSETKVGGGAGKLAVSAITTRITESLNRALHPRRPGLDAGRLMRRELVVNIAGDDDQLRRMRFQFIQHARSPSIAGRTLFDTVTSAAGQEDFVYARIVVSPRFSAMSEIAGNHCAAWESPNTAIAPEPAP
ncbi:hypothetical protein GCM10022383_02850 [Microbacterium soli]|uniref:Uncharacterized protein n=1 Tax=Microbacterium soli TaxID=446075 RepID=A0ABP7MRM6_9MICO